MCLDVSVAYMSWRRICCPRYESIESVEDQLQGQQFGGDPLVDWLNNTAHTMSLTTAIS